MRWLCSLPVWPKYFHFYLIDVECQAYNVAVQYADPVLDFLDKTGSVHHRLFRESCLYYNGSFVKDLSILGRDLRHTLIVDNSPTSYIFHPTNAVPISSWFDNQEDVELETIWHQLKHLSTVDNVMLALEPTSPPSSDDTQAFI